MSYRINKDWAEHAARLAYMPPRLKRPSQLPEAQSHSAWAAGWYAGLAAGLVNGLGLAVLLGWLK